MALLTLAEAKAQLNISTSTNDVELEAYIAGVTTAIEAHVGPVDPRPVQETYETPSCGARAVVLRQTPVQSLTSVTPVLSGGVAYNVTGLTVDATTGTVRRLDGGRFYGLLLFSYMAGRSEVAATLNLAGRLMLQHLWRTQRGSARGPVIAGGDDYDVNEPVGGWGYAIPNRVLELLAPYKLPPVVG
ncbi:head-tail connector protein [Micromonospora parva]|uniref:head-tail connector protein n=1 Tax=Micromonospora parva TaxID=1464048 RepID=UPI00365C0FB2